MYHGSPDERQRLRTEEMRLSDAHSLPKMSKGRSGVTAEKPTIAFPVVSGVRIPYPFSPSDPYRV